ncbi:MAG: VCBS repeat-containing protein [Candidatus Riflebacteria bacterium]|nr:VCBS repeat-containing protein [Candidatus Riflebacteria bacterium]
MSLQKIPVLDPANLTTYVRDKVAAIKLGKAFFWDMQVGSDGIQACATCHFHAGADSRFKNTSNPGTRATTPDTTFQKWGANAFLRIGDFPLTTNEVVGSQGCVNAVFTGVVPGNAVDSWTPAADLDGFRVSGQNTRRVTARQAPTTINAVFNQVNFWDGRASNTFNGTSPGGPGAEAYLLSSNATGTLTQVQVAIQGASLASQAVGPPLADEMSWAGQTWPDIGKKMLTLRPLAKQKVSPTDSVLGALASTDRGLTTSYVALIQQAFVPSWWNSDEPAVVGGRTYTQMEANFPLFWGLAIQLYEATLVSDQSPFDRFASNEFFTGDPTAMTALEQSGLNLFNGKGRCMSCHGGHHLSDAADAPPGTPFYDIGVRPHADDLGAPVSASSLGAAGAFKVSSLRNIELTGPYFHNGGKATLDEVMELYDRGGDFPNSTIIPLGLTNQEEAALKAFLLALTDERVRWESAPFDHPELLVPNGHPGSDTWLAGGASGPGALDSFLTLPAVGAGGRKAAGLPPIQPFLAGAKYAVPADFDQDGKSDLSIWRPSDGTWYNLRSSDRGASMRQWGTAGDTPVSADYDGDGRSDQAVWRPSEGNWYVLRSSDRVATATQWGTGSFSGRSDVPVPGDYDGDAKADLAVWRPAEGNWYVLRSSDGVQTTAQWGTGTLFAEPDVPVSGDYDADGKADLAVWRPSDGTWYVLRSSDGVVTTAQWGTSGDKPVPADFDGDGKTDAAIFRPSDGNWHIRQSSTSAATRVQWGAATDVPVAGDFDADGRADLAVWRPATGNWYVLRSRDGVQLQEAWGAEKDLPVPRP